MTTTSQVWLGPSGELLAAWLRTRRWFGGKGRDFDVTEARALPWLLEADEAGPHCRVELVTVTFTDGTSDTYQLLTAYLRSPDDELQHAQIGEVDEPELGRVSAYDALQMKEATAALVAGFRAARDADGIHRRGGVELHTLPGAELPAPDATGTMMSAEQSNTSIVFDQDAILKVFRRVADGSNPDIEIHEALTGAGFESVAPLLGWIRTSWTSETGDTHTADLAMLQSFLRTATDGWDLALASVRDLLAEQDLHPEEVGGDFAGESERLGETVAAVHQELARMFPTAEMSESDRAETAALLLRRLDDAVQAVPELAPHRDRLAARMDRVRTSEVAERFQRVHGDLHLGQTMRTVKGWKILDFEGEPAKPLAERVRLASPVRDVAGMLRSFDYAAGATLQEFGDSPQLTYRAAEWSERNRAAFLTGYASVAGARSAQDTPLLAAYEADKAVYEVVYEARNRPGWLEIPMRAIARITAED